MSAKTQEEVETQPSHQKRSIEVRLDDEDALVRLLGLDEGDYISVAVNSSWPEKSLLEGDLIIFQQTGAAGAGDIVLIEDEGQVRLGIVSRPGFLETINGRRPLEASERIIGVGVALARRIGEGREATGGDTNDFSPDGMWRLD